MSFPGSPRRRPDDFRIRTAGAGDTGVVRALDDACFPPGDPDREPAPEGELECAVAAGDVRLLELGGTPVGYVHADTARPDRIYISGVGVHPDWQHRGLGSRLIDDCLASVEPGVRTSVALVTITSPRNLVMLRVICARGFRARWYLPDYFGPEKHRLGCQLSWEGRPADPARILLVPAGDLVRLRGLLDSGAWVVRGVRGIGQSALRVADVAAAYELVPYEATDFVAGDPLGPG